MERTSAARSPAPTIAPPTTDVTAPCFSAARPARYFALRNIINRSANGGDAKAVHERAEGGAGAQDVELALDVGEHRPGRSFAHEPSRSRNARGVTISTPA